MRRVVAQRQNSMGHGNHCAMQMGFARFVMALAPYPLYPLLSLSGVLKECSRYATTYLGRCASHTRSCGSPSATASHFTLQCSGHVVALRACAAGRAFFLLWSVSGVSVSAIVLAIATVCCVCRAAPPGALASYLLVLREPRTAVRDRRTPHPQYTVNSITYK